MGNETKEEVMSTNKRKHEPDLDDDEDDDRPVNQSSK